MRAVSPHYLTGALYGFAAVSIWASWSVVTRLAVTTSLDVWDISALRFGVAGLLLAPVLVRRGLALDRLGWLGLAAMIAGTGWWPPPGCALRPPMTAARSIPVACRCLLP
ncbi:MAG TPA: hypothetical protein VL985_00825 [Stellaceae bacterium]|nr:hypothetical protein [Stellaceae bacterium]